MTARRKDVEDDLTHDRHATDEGEADALLAEIEAQSDDIALEHTSGNNTTQEIEEMARADDVGDESHPASEEAPINPRAESHDFPDEIPPAQEDEIPRCLRSLAKHIDEPTVLDKMATLDAATDKVIVVGTDRLGTVNTRTPPNSLTWGGSDLLYFILQNFDEDAFKLEFERNGEPLFEMQFQNPKREMRGIGSQPPVSTPPAQPAPITTPDAGGTDILTVVRSLMEAQESRFAAIFEKLENKKSPFEDLGLQMVEGVMQQTQKAIVEAVGSRAKAQISGQMPTTYEGLAKMIQSQEEDIGKAREIITGDEDEPDGGSMVESVIMRLIENKLGLSGAPSTEAAEGLEIIKRAAGGAA